MIAKKWIAGAIMLGVAWSAYTYVRNEQQQRCAPLQTEASQLLEAATHLSTQSSRVTPSSGNLETSLAILNARFAEGDTGWKAWANKVLEDPSCFDSDDVKAAQVNVQHKQVQIPPMTWSMEGFICADGWRSPSSGSGTCSHHGGIRFSVWRHTDGSEKVCPRSSRGCPYED